MSFSILHSQIAEVDSNREEGNGSPRLVQRSTGSALMTTNPRPSSTSSSIRCNRGASVGSGTSAVVIDVKSIPFLSNFPNARSTSAISTSENRSIQSSSFANSGPYHADRSLTSGGISQAILYVLCFFLAEGKSLVSQPRLNKLYSRPAAFLNHHCCSTRPAEDLFMHES